MTEVIKVIREGRGRGGIRKGGTLENFKRKSFLFEFLTMRLSFLPLQIDNLQLVKLQALYFLLFNEMLP